MEAGVHQVEVSQEASGPAREDQCKRVNETKNGMKLFEGGDLLVEGEEQEYFLELLMRKAPSSQPTEPKAEVSALKGRRNKNLGKKIRKTRLSKGATGKEPRREKEADPVGGGERQVASNLAHNPEAKGRGLAGEGRQKGSQATAPPSTSGGECSG